MATYNKYKYYKRQYLSGDTWVDVEPLELTLSGVSYGTYDTLEDCINSITPSMNFKFKLTSDTYPPYTLACNESTVLCGGEIVNDMYETIYDNYDYSTGSGYVGNCVTKVCTSDCSTPTGLRNVKDLIISDTVTEIGAGTYSPFGVALETIQLPSGLTEVKNYLFNGNRNLQHIELPQGVTSIGHNAFTNCSAMTYCIIPSACTSIGYEAFSGCTSLINTTISNPSVVLGTRVFAGCTSLQSATINANRLPYDTFSGCTNLRTVNLGSSLTGIENQAFYGCSSLSAITFPNTLTSISGSAFQGCSSLSSVTIPDSVTSLSAYCFYDCTELTGVTIGSGMTAIGNSAFTKNDKITTVYCYAETPPLMGSHVFDTYYNNEWHPISGMTIYVPCSSIQDYKTSSGWSGYSTCIAAIPGTENNCTVKAVLTTSQGTEYIYCDSSTYLTNRETSAYTNTLTSAVVGGGTGCVTIIDGNAFAQFDNLKSVIINSGITTINSSSFRQSYNLSSVTIPDTVTSIGGYAFYNCTGLTETLEIPSGVTTIYDYTFYGTNCNIKIKNKSNVIYLPDGIRAFQGNTSTRYIYVPCSMLDTYKATAPWTGLTDYIVGYEDDGTPCDPSNYMKLHYRNQYNTGTVECSSSTTLTSGEVLNLFMSESYPNYIKFGKCVTAIGNNAFGNRGSSPYIYMDSNTPNILEFPSNITSIGQEAFYGCSGFRSLVLNSNITSIGNWAFRECSGLTAVTFSSTTPPTIGTNIFSGCTSLQAIYVPCESVGSYLSVANLSEYSDKIVGSGAEYRWIVGSGASDYICSGVDKYEKEYRQISCDNGTTWSTIYPYETRLGDLLEEDSPDCPFNGKFNATYSGGETYSAACDSSQYLNSGETRPSGYQYTAMTDAVIGDCSNLYNIHTDCFAGFTNLRKCIIGSNIRTIGKQAFRQCSSLSAITIPNSVRTIGDDAFAFSGLKNITIPDTVWSISGYSFYYCTSLTSCTIGSGATIGNYSFKGCSSLTSIIVNATTPPVLGTQAFDNTNNCPILVPAESVNTYKSASGWSTYADRIQAIPTPISGDYLTFVATESGTFKFSGNSINYSLDNGSTWNSLASNTDSPTVESGHTIMWKASLTPASSSGIGRFSSTAHFTVEGNIMSLLYDDNFSEQTSLSGKNYSFLYLFSGCTGMTSAENLSLPATTLAGYCYGYMFQGCTSLTTAPSLPATTLASFCYQGMFNGCTSLITAPSLPATTLASFCYTEMFWNCTSLTTAPELPATTLASFCYQYMFNGCSNLNSITCLATNISATNCTYDWVNGVASSGTFTKASSMTSWTEGANGIPSGWTVQDA